MKTKKLLGTTIAALFAISIVGVAAAVQSWQGINDDTVTAQNSNITVLSVNATDTVPRNTDELAGFAWLYANGNNSAFAITTHAFNADDDPKNEVRDSTQNPDGWHAHNVVLGNGTLDSSRCVKEISDAPQVGIAFNDNLIDVHVKNSDLTGLLSSASAAFSIIVDNGCADTIGTDVTEAGPLPLGIVIHDIHP